MLLTRFAKQKQAKSAMSLETELVGRWTSTKVFWGFRQRWKVYFEVLQGQFSAVGDSGCSLFFQTFKRLLFQARVEPAHRQVWPQGGG